MSDNTSVMLVCVINKRIRRVQCPRTRLAPGPRRCVLLEAVIGVERPLPPARGELGIQPVGGQHHEDEVGVELLLLFFHTAQIVIVRLRTCRRQSLKFAGHRGKLQIC